MLRIRGIVAAAAPIVLTAVSSAQEVARFATYAIKFLEAGESEERLAKIRETIDLLDADVIGLQEIDDRAALEDVFDSDDRHLVIDDDSGDTQDLALAVRSDWELPEFSGDLDADDQHFLFEGSANNSQFPRRRDVLAVRVHIPESDTIVVVMVVHAKSRYRGRPRTDARREGAARDLVELIREDYDEIPFVLLGDFNGKPDDRSLNILETGDLKTLPDLSRLLARS